MGSDWIKVYITSNPVEASIVLSMLRENDIEAVEMNKIDSSYTTFGRAEIYCRKEKADLARQLIAQANAQ